MRAPGSLQLISHCASPVTHLANVPAMYAAVDRREDGSVRLWDLRYAGRGQHASGGGAAARENAKSVPLVGTPLQSYGTCLAPGLSAPFDYDPSCNAFIGAARRHAGDALLVWRLTDPVPVRVPIDLASPVVGTLELSEADPSLNIMRRLASVSAPARPEARGLRGSDLSPSPIHRCYGRLGGRHPFLLYDVGDEGTYIMSAVLDQNVDIE